MSTSLGFETKISTCSILVTQRKITPNLKSLALSGNKLTGFQPQLFGNFRFLQFLQLMDNNLRVEVSSFITWLTRCRSLTYLNIGVNPLNGILPPSVGNLSSSLQYFYADNCTTKGIIPPEIGNLSSLVALSLSGNGLTGNIPPTIKNLYTLQGLDLSNNKIKGPVPESLCGLHSIYVLVLGQNQFSEPIPECLGNLTSLSDLYLSSNNLSSSIPSSLWHLKDLLWLDLSSNYLSGALPLQVGNLASVLYINLYNNHLSQSIPNTIGNLQNLLTLSLAQNRLQGSVPASVGSMISLAYLDLSHNNLSGSIPKSLEALQYLKYLNVSFNDLRGEIPDGGPFKNFTAESFLHNEALCGALRFNVSPCQTVSHQRLQRKKVQFAMFIVAGMIVLITIISVVLIFKKCTRRGNRASGVDELESIVPERISYFDILRATEGFSESNLLGIGSFGSVFRGVVREGRIIAVKVFNLQSEAASRSFDVECEVLRNIRHRNLIKVISSCCNESFRALILEYMPKGSLEKWLYSHNYCLDVMQRMNVMIDLASALEYLHHGYATPIVHCDLKPSNVLLDENMTAHVSDFGIAKLLGIDESSVLTNTLTTLGYIAPEYGLEGLVSRKSDVYSYGILLMETFTRKRPSDDMFGGDMSLRSWVERSSVIDANLVRAEDGELEKKMKCVSSILELGLKCAAESPRDRIDMKQALAQLHKIKLQFSH